MPRGAGWRGPVGGDGFCRFSPTPDYPITSLPKLLLKLCPVIRRIAIRGRALLGNPTLQHLHSGLRERHSGSLIMAPTKMLSSTACRLARQQSSPAVLFVHHCRRASSASAATANYPTSWNSVQSPAYSIPEFLLPSRTHRTIHRPAFPTTLSLRRQRFAYSTATPSDAAKVVLNPRKDDDGNDLWMKISPRAAEVGGSSVFLL